MTDSTPTEAIERVREAAGETLEQYADRIVAATRKKLLDRLDDDVIGSIKESHLIFGKACAMEAVTTACNEMAEYRASDAALATAKERDEGWRIVSAVCLLATGVTGQTDAEIIAAIHKMTFDAMMADDTDALIDQTGGRE